MLGEFIEAGVLYVLWQRPVISVEFLQIRFEFGCVNERLIGPQKKRDDAFVKVVGGNTHVAKRQVVDVRDVNFVLRACRRLHGNGD